MGEVDATAQARVLQGTAPGAVTSSVADLQYYFTVLQVRPFPAGVPQVLIPIKVSGDVIAVATVPPAPNNIVAGAGSFVYLTASDGSNITGVTTNLQRGAGQVPLASNEVPLRLDWSLRAGDVYGIHLHAEVEAGTGLNGETGKASAIADPAFYFDQPRFDANAAALGFTTFPLDQYLSFEFSPGLDELGVATSVPEPGTAWLLGCGLVILLGSAGARKTVLRPSAPQRGPSQ
jgi:hypothetical protein